MTEDSQKVVDEHYQKFVVEQQERLKTLELQGEAAKAAEQKEDEQAEGNDETKEDSELRQAALSKLQSMSSKDGVSSKVLKTSPLMGGDSEVLHDEYNLERDTEQLKRSLYADNDEDDVNGDGGAEERGPDFLKVYKENTDGPAGGEAEDEGIKDGQVKYKREA